MTLNDILSKTLEFIGDETLSLNGTDKKSKTLVSAGKMVCNELASVYTSPVTEESVKFTGGKAGYKDFSKRIKNIISVKGKYGKLTFEQHNAFVYACGAEGFYDVKYSYIPEEAAIGAELDLPPQLTAEQIANGVAAEYYYRQGFTDEAAFYKNRYDLALVNQLREKRSFILKIGRML